MASNLRLSEAARLVIGDAVVFDSSTFERPNPNMIRGLTSGGVYRIAELKYCGFKKGATVPEEVTLADFNDRPITDGYGKPLTNVCLRLKDIDGFRCSCYFRRA